MKFKSQKNYEYDAFIDFMTRMILKYDSTVGPHVKDCVSQTGSKRMTFKEYIKDHPINYRIWFYDRK